MAKKIILIVLGVLLGLCGLLFICTGGVLLGFGGTGGTFQSGFHSISTPTVAMVSDPASVENSTNVKSSPGTITIHVNGRSSSKPLFIGVGPAAQVQSYLSGSPYTQISKVDFSPFRLTTNVVNGANQPGRPTDQAFWVAKSTGADPRLSWQLAGGDYSLVLMNADGSPNVALDAQVGAAAPIVGRIAIGSLIGGIVGALLGLFLLIVGIRTRRPQPQVGYPAGYAGYPPGGYQPPADSYGGQPPTTTQPSPYQGPSYPPPGASEWTGSPGPAPGPYGPPSEPSGPADDPEPPGGAEPGGWQPPDDPRRG